MNKKDIISFLKLVGFDKAIAYSSAARIFQSISGFITLIFITLFLTKEEQGYYYTFFSIIGIQVFFELGLTNIITQFVAHEAIHLNLDKDLVYRGESKYKSRLSSLLHFCIKWYFYISILLIIVLTIVGFSFFETYGNKNNCISWKVPWVILVISTGLKLFQSPLSAFIYGLGKVTEINEIMFYQQLIIPISIWIGLMLGMKLYIVSFSSLLSVLIWQIYIWKAKIYGILVNLYNVNVVEKISYLHEILPLQWKIALSWISGYFIFQLFNPILFASEGATIAGQMGMTLSILNAISSFCMNWISTKVPKMCGYIEIKQYRQLDKLFFRTQKQMISICFFIIIAMYVTIFMIRHFQVSFGGNLLGDRFLDYVPMILMTIPVLRNQFVFSWATYLRCHKKEPYLLTSVVSAILCASSALLFGYKYGVYGLTISYFIITTIMTPWNYKIFINKRREWHEQ